LANGQSLKVLSEAIGPGFLECDRKRSATPLFLLSFSTVANRLALKCSDYTAVESAVVRFALLTQSKIETGGGESFWESLM
jgi:hypothetical protein